MTRVVFVVVFCALIAQAIAEITSFKLPKTRMVVGERVQIGWEFSDDSNAQSSVLQINVVPEGGNFATDTLQDLTVDEHAKRYIWHVDVPPNKYFLHALGADSEAFDVVGNTSSSDEPDTTTEGNNGTDNGNGDSPNSEPSSQPNSPGQENPSGGNSTSTNTDTKSNNTALVAGIVVVAAVAVCGLGMAGYLALRMRNQQHRLVSDILAAREEGLAKEGKGSFANTADARRATPDHPQTGQPAFGSR